MKAHLVLCIFLTGLIGAAPQAAAKKNSVLIQIQDRLPAPAQFALQELQTSLIDKGFAPALGKVSDPQQPQQAAIRLLTQPDSANAKWDKPESYQIRLSNHAPQITVAGSDSIGLMYGIHALREQIEMSKSEGSALWRSLKEKSAAPATEIRADNLFLTLESDGSLSTWFYEEEFWKRYFSTLARSYYNLCDIHAMFSLNETNFPNIFPYFLRNPAFPEASLPNEDQAKNLSMLKRIIDLAEERGVHVSLMNYSIKFPNLDPENEEKLIEQTSWCVCELLKACPNLWMFGFRIGESGKRENFYKLTYFDGIARSGKKDARLYTRTWLAQFKDMKQIGMRYPENFYIEIKYNGEQLGTPYQAIQGRWGSYSYERYLNHPRYWKIIWQVRANGTHRIFEWADPDFIRQMVQSCKLADAAGLTIEPPTAYYTQDLQRVFTEQTNTSFMHYAFERYWPWYLLWGRLTYDPNISNELFIHYFKKRFGEKMGARAFDLLTTSSKILPLIYSHHCLGPDHRHMAPEMESGNNRGNIDSFIKADVLDKQNYLSCENYVDDFLAHRLDGKVTPFQAAAELEALADQCRSILAKIPATTGEISIMKTDVRALCELAQYYADKDRAACSLQLYYRTHDVSQVIDAQRSASLAAEHWRSLAKVTAQQYRPIFDALRVGKQFVWADGLKDMQADSLRISAVRTEIEKADTLTIGHVPVPQAQPQKDLVLIAGLATSDKAKVTLHYKVGSRPMQSATCTPADAWTFQAVIKGLQLRQGDQLSYWFSATDGATSRTAPRDTLNPYQTQIDADVSGPVIEWNPKTDVVDRSAGKVRVSAKITDISGVKQARVEWKPMPSDLNWASPIEMRRTENTFSADVPLTYEGLLYSITAFDNLGNATRNPYVREATPYIPINPWDRGLPPEFAKADKALLPAGIESTTLGWPKVTKLERPGSFYQYQGSAGQIRFPFTVEAFSDYRMTLAAIGKNGYGTAKILIDDREIGTLDGHLDVDEYMPIEQEIYVSRLTPGAHTLTFETSDNATIGLEGFRFEAVPAMVDQFYVSQSIPGSISQDKDYYPFGKSDINWQPAQISDRGVLYFDKQLKPNKQCYAYAATAIVCPKEVETHLLSGSRNIMVWLNGELVLSRMTKRPFVYNGDRIQIHLKRGENVLVVLSPENDGIWRFNINLETYDFSLQTPSFIKSK